jgi:DNA ligase-1
MKNSASNNLKKFPKLYGRTKNGSIKTWEIWVESLFGEVCIKMRHGLKDGKKTLSSRLVEEGKNIGKSNETTPTQQAIKEAKARWQKQVDKGYVDKESNVDNIFNYFPMLAKTYEIGITTLPEKMILQPKLNGVRCVAVKKDNVVKLYSRNGKEYTAFCPNVVKSLALQMTNGEIYDGELYVHGWSFKRIIECVKRDKSVIWRKKIKYHVKKREWEEAYWWAQTRLDNQKIQYHIYDVPSDMPFMKRLQQGLDYIVETDVIKKVDTGILPSHHGMVKLWHDKYVKQGYEGCIIRDADSPYLWGHRGKRLLKYKEFIDEEFEITGYKQGTGTDAGAIVFICRVGKGKGRNLLFDARPRGEINKRRIMWGKRKSYLGRMLTVRFQEWSDKGVPIFPVGLEIRDYE